MSAIANQTAAPPTTEFIRGPEDAAAYISEHYFPCTARYVRELTDTNQIVYYKIAGRRHYKPSDIAVFVESRRVATAGGAA